MISNLVREKISAGGTGDITLAGAFNGATTIASVFGNGDKLFYSLIDGNNRENGLGTYNSGANSITRNIIFETIVNGVFDNTTPSAISATTAALISVSPSVQALATHIPMWKRAAAIPGDANLAFGAGAPVYAALLGTIEIPYYAAAGTTEAPYTFIANHDINGSTPLYPTVHWTANDNAVGNVRWGLEYTIASFDGSFSASSTIYIEGATGEAADEHLMTEFADQITITQPTDIIAMRLFRDGDHANDTYANTAGVTMLSFAYQAEYQGTPRRNSDFYNWG